MDGRAVGAGKGGAGTDVPQILPCSPTTAPSTSTKATEPPPTRRPELLRTRGEPSGFPRMQLLPWHPPAAGEACPVPSLSPPRAQLLCLSWELWMMLGWHPLLGSCPLVPRAVEPRWRPRAGCSQSSSQAPASPVPPHPGDTPGRMSPGSSICSALLLTCQKIPKNLDFLRAAGGGQGDFPAHSSAPPATFSN